MVCALSRSKKLQAAEIEMEDGRNLPAAPRQAMPEGPLPPTDVPNRVHAGNPEDRLSPPRRVAAAGGLFGGRRISGLTADVRTPAIVDPVMAGLAAAKRSPEDRPSNVSTNVWGAVFPPDRAEARRRAGRHFLKGVPADEAIRLATDEISQAIWAGDSALAALRRELAPFFPESARMSTAINAALAVGPDARRHWREIIGATDQRKAAFKLRSWHAVKGTCLLCGEPTRASDPVFGGDGLHVRCKAHMAEAGPAFGGAVARACAAIAADPPPEAVADRASPRGEDDSEVP